MQPGRRQRLANARRSVTGRVGWTTGLVAATVTLSALIGQTTLGIIVAVPLALAATRPRPHPRSHTRPRPTRPASDPPAVSLCQLAAQRERLCLVDVTEQVADDLARVGGSGLATVAAGAPGWVVRVNEREGGFFADLEQLLARIVPPAAPERERLLTLLLGPSGDTVPFTDGRLALGGWQRIFLVGFGQPTQSSWTISIVGSHALAFHRHELELDHGRLRCSASSAAAATADCTRWRLPGRRPHRPNRHARR